MLTIFDKQATTSCDGYSRRDLLRIGTLGLAGLTLPGLLEARARAAASGGYLADRSVVFLFLRGGATQFETWDPKMTAPKEIRAMFGEVKTRLPGVTYGSHFPKLAAMADRLAVVRSFRVGTSNHGQGRERVLSAGNPMKAPLGAVYSRLAGTTHPTRGMPSNILLTPRSVGAEYAGLQNAFAEALATGTLPADVAAFDPGAGTSAPAAKGGKKKVAPAPASGGLLADMQMRLTAERLADRRSLLQQIDALRQGLDQSQTLEGYDRFQQQAFDVIVRGVQQAFDLSREDPRTIARYDTSASKIPPAVLKKKKKDNTPKFAPVALGKQMLLARRLCEAGCGFVTVTSDGWDMHGNAFGVDDGMACLGPAVDHAVSAFLQDVHERGLSDKILLVISGEMGRTPKINKKAGRDHWAGLCSLALAGGGLKMGQVVGQSDRQGGAPATTPIEPLNLLGTVMHTLFDVGQLRITSGLPADILRVVTSAEPIAELVS